VYGPTLDSIVFLYLTAAAASAACLIARYRGYQRYFLVLYFFAATVSLPSLLRFIHQIPVGGIRYFSVFAILPASHILFEFVRATEANYKLSLRYLLLLAVQVFFLTGAIFIRGSPAYLAMGIGTAALLLLLRNLRHVAARRSLISLTGFFLVSVMLFSGLVYGTIPQEYKASGRVTGVLWHRAVVSFAVHPSWPFGNLTEIYDCRSSIPEGLGRWEGDKNGHCIWVSVGSRKGMTAWELVEGVYDIAYENTMRTAFFDILRMYPREAAETFLYYKPAWLINAIVASFGMHFHGNTSLWLITLAELAAMVLFRLLSTDRQKAPWALLLVVLGLFAVFAVLPQLVAWSIPHTIADISIYVLMGLGLLLGEAANAVWCRIPRLRPGRVGAIRNPQ
jgi:hypothetical protein